MSDSEEFNKLFETFDLSIWREIAQHPNIPPDLLHNLFYTCPLEVLNNPALDLLVLEKRFSLEYLYISLTGVFERIFSPYYKSDLEMPGFFIEWAINHKNEKIRANVAGSPNIPAHFLEQLADDDSCRVICNLSLNSNLSESIKAQVEKRKSQFISSCILWKDYECECSGHFSGDLGVP